MRPGKLREISLEAHLSGLENAVDLLHAQLSTFGNRGLQSNVT